MNLKECWVNRGDIINEIDRSRKIPHSGEKIGSSASISLHNQDPNELQKRGRVEAKGESRQQESSSGSGSWYTVGKLLISTSKHEI